MPIIVNSPYSGRPVKLRDQDIERAIRDEEGRIFYVVTRSDGDGYYASPTRKGSAKDEQRYLEMAAKGLQAHQVGAARSASQIHDATGTRRRGRRGRRARISLLIIVLILAAIAYVLFVRPQWLPPALRDLIPSRDPAAPAEPTSPGRSARAEPQAAHVIATPNPEPADPHPDFILTGTGLRYRVDKPGTGPIATAGSYLVVDYTRLTAAETGPSGRPDSVGFVLWSGQVMRGWDEGIAGMRVGEKRTLLIPPILARFDHGGTTPAGGAPVRFEVELRDVLPAVSHTIHRRGNGPTARPGDVVEVHYTGFVDGQDEPWDSTFDRDAPMRFRIGAGQLIPGWELGVVGMATGEKRTIVIPPYLAYGRRGFGDLIRPDATLRYEVELIRIEADTESP